MEDGLHAIVSDRHVAVLVAERQISLANIDIDYLGDGLWWLARLKVREGYQGQGMGSKILKRAQDELSALPHFLALEVAPGGYASDPIRLEKFYESHGFVRENSGSFRWRKT